MLLSSQVSLFFLPNYNKFIIYKDVIYKIKLHKNNAVHFDIIIKVFEIKF